MAPKVRTSLLFLPFIFLASSVVAYDIVEMLQPYGDYNTFVKYLTETKVAEEINRRKSTVLAVADSAIAPLSSLTADNLKKVISLHVIIDYYDPYNLAKLPNKTALLRTLFEDSGLATNQMGYVNYTELPGEQMVFGSAAPGSPHNSNLDKVVAARPYDLCVLQISAPIVPQGIENTAEATPTAVGATAKSAPESSPEAPAEGAATTDAEESPAKTEESSEKLGESSEKQSGAAATVVSASLGLAMGAIALGAL